MSLALSVNGHRELPFSAPQHFNDNTSMASGIFTRRALAVLPRRAPNAITSFRASLSPAARAFVTTPRSMASAAEIAAEVEAEASAASASSSKSAPKAKNGTAPSMPKLVESIIDVNGTDDSTTDWSKSYFGLSAQPFDKEVAEILMAPVDPLDIEMKPGS